jgi:putative transposase
MPLGLERRQNTGQLHFITLSCYGRLPYLASAQSKDTLERVIERTRRSHKVALHAYVLMPEHIHLLLSEPQHRQLSSTIRVLKGESSKLLKGTRERFWQPRYYDFNVFTTPKLVEKVRYIHRNPVTRGLVARPEDYRWSSFNHYATGEAASIEIESRWTASLRERSQLLTHSE